MFSFKFRDLTDFERHLYKRVYKHLIDKSPYEDYLHKIHIFSTQKSMVSTLVGNTVRGNSHIWCCAIFATHSNVTIFLDQLNTSIVCVHSKVLTFKNSNKYNIIDVFNKHLIARINMHKKRADKACKQASQGELY